MGGAGMIWLLEAMGIVIAGTVGILIALVILLTLVQAFDDWRQR